MARHSGPILGFDARSFLALLAALSLSQSAPRIVRAQATALPVTSADIPFSATTPTGVNLATGEYCVQYRETDLLVRGPTDLAFGRYYASYLDVVGVPPSALGTNWRGTYDWRLAVAYTDAQVIDPRGRAVRFQFDGARWQLLEPVYMPFQLVPDGADFLFLDAPSQRVYRFDATGALTRIEDERGTIFTLTHVGGLLSNVEDGLGRALDFTYDPPGHLIAVTDGVRTVRYGYTGDLLTTHQDAANRITSYAYAAPAAIPGLLESKVEPMGNVGYVQTYDALGRVAQQSDALGHTATYGYLPPIGSTETTEWTDMALQAWTITHEIGHALGATHRLVAVQDWQGGFVSLEFDSLGRPNSLTRPLGDSFKVIYDPPSGRASEILRNGGSPALSLTWSPTAGPIVFHHLTGLAFPDGTIESFTYDAVGNLTQMMDRGGFPWSWTYTSRGMPLTFTNAAGDVTTFTYNLGLDLTGLSNGATTIPTIGYNAQHDAIDCQWLDGATRHWTYDDRHRVTGFQNEASVWNFHVWNDNGLLASSTDGLGHATQYQYDLMDRLIGVTDPLGNTLTIARDGLGRATGVTDRSGRTTRYAYDGLGRLVGVTDPGGSQTQYAYDADSRLLSETDPLSQTRSWAWDFFDRITMSTDALGVEEQYGYDVMDRVTSIIGPLSYNRSMSYDARGFLTLYRAAFAQIGLQRHELGGINGYTDPDGKIWSTARDATGRVASRTDPLARTTQYEYDGRNRLFRITSPLVTEALTFDAASRITGIDYTGGPSLAYTYDDAGRMTSATGVSLGYDNANRVVSSNGLTFTRDPDGRILTETYALGKTVTFTYDARGLVQTATDWLGGTTTFAYDPAGRRTSVTRPNGVATQYEYDAMDRLILSTAVRNDTMASVVFTRNARGMIVTADRRSPLMPGVTDPDTTGWAYDDASQVTAFAHDALGRVTNDGVRAYTWDGASRLRSYTEGTTTESFTYDAFERMLSRTQGAVTQTLVWNYAPGVPTLDILQRNVGNPGDALYFVRTPSGELLHSIDGLSNARRFYHYDESGNTIFLTSDLGSVVTSYAYLPLGTKTAIGQTAGNPFTWGTCQGFMELASPSGGLYDRGPGKLTYDAKTGRTLAPLAVPVPADPGLGNPYIVRVGNDRSNGVYFDFISETLRNGSFDQGADFAWPRVSAPPAWVPTIPVRYQPPAVASGNYDMLEESLTFGVGLHKRPGQVYYSDVGTIPYVNSTPSLSLFDSSARNIPLIGSISIGFTMAPMGAQTGPIQIDDPWRRPPWWPAPAQGPVGAGPGLVNHGLAMTPGKAYVSDCTLHGYFTKSRADSRKCLEWSLEKAWPMRWEGPRMDQSDSGLALECLELAR